MELLHSREYLQAVLQFAAHIQALTKQEHQLLAKSAAPLKLPEYQLHPGAEVVMRVETLTTLYAAALWLLRKSVHAAEQRMCCMAGMLQIMNKTLYGTCAGTQQPVHTDAAVSGSSQPTRCSLDHCAAPPAT